jgi:hypothetical protein
MKKIFIIGLLLSANLFAYELEGKWKEINRQDGITVWSAEVKGRSIVAFKGNVDINASIQTIASILADSSRKHLWIAKLKSIKTLERPTPFSAVEHYEIQTPWFLSNRDFVYRADMKLSKDKQQIFVTVKSITHKKQPPVDGIVRAEVVEGKYILTKIAKKRTNVVVQMLADPKGSIPKWVVNIYQKSWPYLTLKKIKELAESGTFPMHKTVKRAFSSATR